MHWIGHDDKALGEPIFFFKNEIGQIDVLSRTFGLSFD